ncbi:MAG: DNA ligase D [Methylobacteriaceae bacterium]|nr:DNA ligase D [Methylobacteriaceae bacterium]
MAKGLATYNEKRNFGITSEPRGRKAKAGGFSFVVQKHAATRLHYDFRLELDGVLKSWAVTRGPSLVPGEKRLAVQTEDHPLDYGDFEGNIPKGQYGGGAVLVWDRGTWKPEGDPQKGLAKGHLDFSLDGTKLEGRWHLVRLKPRAGEKRDNWLLIKSEDEAARHSGDPDILEEKPKSAKTGRTIEQVAGDSGSAVWQSNRSDSSAVTKKKALSPRERAKMPLEAPAKAPSAKTKPNAASKKAAVANKTASAKSSKSAPRKKKALDLNIPEGARKGKLPGFVEPYLASLSESPPNGAGWLHEIKFDGYRLQAEIDDGRVTLRTRRGLDWTAKFRGIADALATLPVETALIDGEALVEDAKGISDFSSLQNALSEGQDEKIVFYSFDLIYINGYDLRGVPLKERKRALADLLASQTDKSRIRYSSDFEVGGERLLQHVCLLGAEGIVSKRADEPYRSGRAKGWLKAKCADRQEFIIAGYVPSTTSPRAIGSLIAAYNKDGKLLHAGRVGTGYSMKVAQQLFKLLDPDRVQRPPFADPLPSEARRDARFVAPKRVMEVAFRGWTAGGQIRQAAYKGLREDKPPQEVVRESTARSIEAPSAKPMPAFHLTHPDRVLWPEAGITKQGLAEYYVSVWDWIEPHIVKRPLSLVRCPTGISDACFFQKHEWKGMDRAIELIHDPKDGEKLVSVSGLEGLLALVQASALEIHPWGSTGRDLERPDRLIFDLDPGDGVAFTDMIAGAHEIRARLAAMKLASFVKTSGGKGLHVVVPLTPSAGWDEAKDFCRIVAESMERDAPQRYTSIVTKRERKGKIYVDYLRNGRGATAIAPYSPRARVEAGVATPLAWEELSSLTAADLYTLDNIGNRMARLGTDPWADMSKIKQTLPKAKAPQPRAAPARKRVPA